MLQEVTRLKMVRDHLLDVPLKDAVSATGFCDESGPIRWRSDFDGFDEDGIDVVDDSRHKSHLMRKTKRLAG